MEEKTIVNPSNGTSASTSNDTKNISGLLQNFIDSMMEEIVLKGKNFDSQKKYLNKYCEKECLDYTKLEADIITFLEIIERLKTSGSLLMKKLAEEKGRACHISENILKEIIDDACKNRSQYPEKQLKRNNSLHQFFLCVVGFLFYLVVGGGVGILSSIIHFYMYSKPSLEIMHEEHNWIFYYFDREIIEAGFFWGFVAGIIFVIYTVIRHLKRKKST